MGKFREATRVLRVASEVMNTPGGGELRGWGSLVVNESLKRFKGEPFEKAMVDFYVGVMSWMLGDCETARVAFRRALLADKSSAQGYRDDFAPAHFLYALASRVSGDADSFRIGLEKASARWPGNPYVRAGVARGANLVILLEVGRGPRKVESGLMNSFDRFVPVRPPYTGASIVVDGRDAGRASQILDLYFQAKTRGRSPGELVRATKAGLKTGALVTAGVSRDWRVQLLALLFAAFYPSQADTRQVELLPGYMLVWVSRLPAGTHGVQATFSPSADGLKPFVIRWPAVRIYRNGVTLLLGRAGIGPIWPRESAHGTKSGSMKNAK